MAQILIPEYLGRQVRAGIRSLVLKGDYCDLAWDKIFIKTKYIRNYYQITSSDTNDEKYISDIIKIYKEYKHDLILPFGNASYYAVSKNSKILTKNNVNFMAPTYETFKIAHDKYKTYEFCKKIGISVPEIYTNYSDSDINSLSSYLQYPVVIKAKSGVGVGTGLRYANNKIELLKFYHEISSFRANTGASNYEAPIIQEFIPGFIYDACTLTNMGNVITVLTQKRHLMYPIYGGVGAINVTTHDEKLSNLATHLLEEMRWHGPAQLEFKYDERDKTYKLIEINPKLWGTLDLSIKVGVDFPILIRDILLGKEIKKNIIYKDGIRYKFLFPQAIHAYFQMIKELGLNSIIDKNKYAKTYYDFDIQDIFYDTVNVCISLLKVILGRIISTNSNISKKYINRIS